MSEDRDWQRLDKWLWCARFWKARAECARLVGEGSVRVNRQATDKPHAKIRPGDVLTVPLRGDVIVVRVKGLAVRRGPAAEALRLYEVLEGEVTEGAEPGLLLPEAVAALTSPQVPVCKTAPSSARPTDR